MGRRREGAAVLQEPVVALRRPARKRTRRAYAGARRDGVRRRTDRERAGVRLLPVGARRFQPRRLTLFAATFREYGGPEKMLWEELDDPVCAADDVVIDVHACGLN